jgi:hypothetical protein
MDRRDPSRASPPPRRRRGAPADREEPGVHRRARRWHVAAAQAVTRIYKELGILPFGHLDEVAAADLAGATARETARMVSQALCRAGGVLMITEAHIWSEVPDRGQRVLRHLYAELTDYRDGRAVILAGQAEPVRGLLQAHPALAARFPAVIDFPGYTTGQLTEIFAVLAGEAGFTLTPAAACKAATVLAAADGHDTGNARLAVRLLDQANATQARRTASAPRPVDAGALGMICAADIPGHILPHHPLAGDQRPGQYL